MKVRINNDADCYEINPAFENRVRRFLSELEDEGLS